MLNKVRVQSGESGDEWEFLSVPIPFILTTTLLNSLPTLSIMNLVSRLARKAVSAHIPTRNPSATSSLLRFSGCNRHGARFLATHASQMVPHIEAPDLSYAREAHHVRRVADQLQQSGILKVSLQFPDDKSEYLQQLLLSLNKNHNHQLPISHSATRGWFWDVRPSTTDFQTGNHQARSETMEEFPWHTDCSYENPPPRYFALQVLQHDRFGGGTLSVMNVERLSQLLSPTTRAALVNPDYRITIPPEFIKDAAQQDIVGSVLVADAEGRSTMMRFREDILTPLSDKASGALNELKQALQSAEAQSHSTVHLTADDLPQRSIILVDNRRWLHARNDVKDPERHLRRVRWDAVPFSGSN
ncbi:CASlike [Ilyonectria robusta]